MYHRKSSYAGTFYPEDKVILNNMITGFINSAEIPIINKKITGIIVPHAGYIYSGSIAAYSYAAIMKNEFDIALILAPSHRAHFNGYSVITSGYMETPIGVMTVDANIGSKLNGKPLMCFNKEVDIIEHSLEVQLPFIQNINNNCSIVPVIIGTSNRETCDRIADEIYNAIYDDKRNIIIILSTDLSHYYSYKEAINLDTKFINGLLEFDETSLIDTIKSGSEACGLGPILTGINLLRRMGSNEINILKYGNSGDTAGDKNKVVGYLSAIFTR
jgi:AmmeMemoRadiSam system protein B